MEVVAFPKSAALTAHKSLPRRQGWSSKAKRWSLQELELETARGTTYPAGDRSWQIQSWIPEPPHIEVNIMQRLPLTPPSLARDTEAPESLKSLSFKGSAILINQPGQSSGLSTPAYQRSPPTPEITPPGRRLRSKKLTPPTTSLLSSSRAESFKTAHEQLSSESEDEEVHSPPPDERSLRKRWLHHTEASGSRTVGLGLDLESTNHKTPMTITPHEIPKGRSFGAFDVAWGSSAEEVNEDSSRPTELGPQHSRSLRKKPLEDQLSAHNIIRDSLSKTVDFALRQGPSLRERIEKNKSSPPTASTEQFAEQIQWPAQDALDIDAKMRQMDNRRLSQMSASSTVVEAMVVDNSPRRQHTLRHTNKNASLRTTSLPRDVSNRSSLVSDGSSRQHAPRFTRYIPGDNRSSTASDVIANADSGFAKTRWETIPQPLVPLRRSSLRSSKTQRHSRALSPTAGFGDSSTPATTADTCGLPSGKVRLKAGSIASSTTLRSKAMKPRENPPVVPTRSSSLSAPTSKNVSRTTSLTSTSLHAHDVQQDLQFNQPQLTIELTPDEDHHSVSSEKSSPEYLSALQQQSRLVTPFSIVSAQSSTPGTLEVNEATLVNLYPHNNKSILIVQQKGRRGSQRQSETQPTVAETPNISLPATDYSPHGIHQPQAADSPLRHPRDAPQPPAFTIIPPTPIPPLGTPTTEVTPGTGTNSNGPLSTLKRAFSTRRYSDTFITPITRSINRRNTLNHHRPAPSDNTTDNKLSPFWRPRGFWNDLSDSESDFGNDMPRKARPPSSPSSNPKRVSTLSRKFGSLRLPSRRFASSPPNVNSSSNSLRQQKSHELFQANHGTKMGGVLPRSGYQISLANVGRQVRDGIERRRIRREEERREREREKLRVKIGRVVGVVDPGSVC